jgi:hypothetical protein
MGITSAGTAESIPGVNQWSSNNTTNKMDVTAFGDSNINYVAGLPDASGTFGGWWDDTSKQSYTAALDGVARKAYFYEDIVANPTSYAYGSILPDFSISVGVGDAISFTASWNAAGPINHS